MFVSHKTKSLYSAAPLENSSTTSGYLLQWEISMDVSSMREVTCPLSGKKF